MLPHSESRPSGLDPQHALRGDRPRFDRLLQLPPDVQAAWEAEFGERRIRHIRFHIVFGLFFYNLYNLTSIVLMPGVVARTLPVLLGRPFPDRLDGVDAAQIK